MEIREVKKKGGLAVGVASDEVRRYGLNLSKRERLIRAGADIIIPDYTPERCLIGVSGHKDLNPVYFSGIGWLQAAVESGSAAFFVVSAGGRKPQASPVPVFQEPSWLNQATIEGSVTEPAGETASVLSAVVDVAERLSDIAGITVVESVTANESVCGRIDSC